MGSVYDSVYDVVRSRQLLVWLCGEPSAVLMHECGACSWLARLHECTDLTQLGAAAVRVRS